MLLLNNRNIWLSCHTYIDLYVYAYRTSLSSIVQNYVRQITSRVKKRKKTSFFGII